jgi:YfiH family protein
MPQVKTQDAISWVEYDLFAEHKNLVHGSLLRQGGLSVGQFDSLNLNVDGNDGDHAVNDNLEKIRRLFAIPKIRHLHQVHGNHVVLMHQWNSASCGDALVGTAPYHALMIKHADCQPALFYDPICKVFGAAHAGRRGSVQNVFAEVIRHFRHAGSKPENILVAIGPSLGPEHAEFLNYRQELPEMFWDYQTKVNHFDFWAISHAQLLACGILPHHIEMARMCTFANNNLCFSYRRDKVTGRNATFIMAVHH